MSSPVLIVYRDDADPAPLASVLQQAGYLVVPPLQTPDSEPGVATVWLAPAAELQQILYKLGVPTAVCFADEDLIERLEAAKLTPLTLLEAGERERARVAKELHDGLCQALAHDLMYLEQWRTQVQQGLMTVDILLDNVREVLQQTLSETRHIMQNLAPTQMLRYGLAGAIDQLTLRYNALDSTQFDFQPEVLAELPPEHPAARATFRIVQELVHNTIRHAGASHVTIYLREDAQAIELDYHDDGEGFDYSAGRLPGNGHGLHNMLERIRLLKGEYRLDTAPGKGFAFWFRLPVVSS